MAGRVMQTRRSPQVRAVASGVVRFTELEGCEAVRVRPGVDQLLHVAECFDDPGILERVCARHQLAVVVLSKALEQHLVQYVCAGVGPIADALDDGGDAGLLGLADEFQELSLAELLRSCRDGRPGVRVAGGATVRNRGTEMTHPVRETAGTPSTVAGVVTALEEDIIFGRLYPRERLVEDTLMQRFDAKRHVVRQAIAELERMGVLVKRQNKGAFVRDYTLSEIEEIYEMRELLHERAARRMPLPAPPEVVVRLRGINTELGRALVDGDLRRMYHLNNEFHDTLFGACGNRYLAESIRHHAWQAHPIRSYRIANPDMFSQALEEHEDMADALERGDRDGLATLCVAHIQPSKEAYIRARPPVVEPDRRMTRHP